MSPDDRLRRWAADTWRSLEAMVDPRTGLPADGVAADLAPTSRSRYTSPTNLGGLLWSAVAARELELLLPEDCRALCERAVASVAGPGGAAQRHLALDQSMVLGALGNLLAGDTLRSAFTAGGVADALRPALAALPDP